MKSNAFGIQAYPAIPHLSAVPNSVPYGEASCCRQCCRSSENIAQVTPKMIFFYIKNRIWDQSIPHKKIFTGCSLFSVSNSAVSGEPEAVHPVWGSVTRRPPVLSSHYCFVFLLLRHLHHIQNWRTPLCTKTRVFFWVILFSKLN